LITSILVTIAIAFSPSSSFAQAITDPGLLPKNSFGWNQQEQPTNELCRVRLYLLRP
jgi:hypothetical protein